ncbi:MAG TPA: glycosyltransferase family 4 protein [Gemmatimonadaceae bacterium]|nr:glycosyltransferase family 4 protein [Gemmatimonadaceae bacterium]
MNVLYIWDADYPWDVRTEKIAAAITAAGDHVHIACRNVAQADRLEVRPEGTVRRLPPWRVLGRRLDAWLSFPAFFNPRWIAHLWRSAREARAEVIVVRDLPLCPTALLVGRLLSVPVVLDMAENYPAMMQDVWNAGRQRPLDILVRNPALVRAVERVCVHRVDHILVVVEESAARLRSLSVSPSRLTVVSNTPPSARVSPPRAPRADADAPLELVYLGIMEIPRGVGDLVQAAALLRDRGEEIHVTLVGDGRDLDHFRDLANELHLGPDVVTFLGRLAHADALDVLRRAEVGVVPHHADEAWNTTIPNKLFDYMAAGLAVLSSDAEPCARVLKETGAGLVFRSGDPAHLAESIVRLRDAPSRVAMARAGQAAVRDRFNWEADAARLRQALERVVCAPDARRAGRADTRSPAPRDEPATRNRAP